MLSFNHAFWQLGHCKSSLVQPLCPSQQNWRGQTDPTSEEEEENIQWGHSAAHPAEGLQGLVGMRGLGTSLSLQENVVESPAGRVGSWGVTSRTGVTQTPRSGPSVSERQKQSCLAG